jgi:MFS family permease
MRKSIQLILLLKNIATGILVSVLTLALLQHGATLRTISLLIGLYSFTVILAEFPSGVFADLYGRKTSFLLSSALSATSYAVFLLSSSAALLCVAIILNGLGRAFASGSIDALVIDQREEYGKTIQWVTSRLAIIESIGLAAGALLGGLLAGVGTRYLGNLGVNACIYVCLFFMTLFFVCEPPRKKTAGRFSEDLRQFGVQTRDSLLFLKQKGTIRILFVLTLATGFALNTVETYWQPALQAMQPPYWIFGAVSFGGFAFVILGSWATERLLTRFGQYGAAMLLLMKALFGGSLILLLFQSAQISFIAVYLTAYLMVGGGSVAENTLLNHLAPASHRAGILSLASLVLQIGGLLAALCGYWMSTHSRYQNMWPLAGAILILCVIVFAIAQAKSILHPAPVETLDQTPDA